MQPGVYQYLQQRPELITFVRMNPIWYRKITRNPDVLAFMEQEAKYFYGHTTSQKIERFGGQVQMLSTLVQMAQLMKE